MKNIHKRRQDGLENGLNALNIATERAVFISSDSLGKEHTGRQMRALHVFSKMISHNMSITTLVNTAIYAPKDASALDHFSVAALGRIVIDACIMALYISEPSLTLHQWNLRRHVLYLHDHTNRKRFLDAMAKHENIIDSNHLEGYPEMKESLRLSIAKYGIVLGLTPDKIDKLQKGEVFVDGVRGAVREAGLNVQAYEAHSSYFSAYIHAHPVSFMRAEEHGLSFSEPSAYQKYLCDYVMQTIAVYTQSVVDRFAIFVGDIKKDPLGIVE